MRKLLLVLGLAMLGVLVFAPAALAQDPCPDPDFPRETPDGCQASNLSDVEFGPRAGTNTIAESCNDQPDPAGCKRQLRGAEGFGSTSVAPSEAASPTATASATASATSSASSAADSQYEAPSLPETGGASAVVPLASLALLATGGLLAAFMVQRG